MMYVGSCQRSNLNRNDAFGTTPVNQIVFEIGLPPPRTYPWPPSNYLLVRTTVEDAVHPVRRALRLRKWSTRTWLRHCHGEAATKHCEGGGFVTLEDEAGIVNVICLLTLVEQFCREVMGAQLLGVHGIWQSESNARHLVAKRLLDLTHLLGELDMRTRDFH